MTTLLSPDTVVEAKIKAPYGAFMLIQNRQHHYR